jgi:hypothetical protein
LTREKITIDTPEKTVQHNDTIVIPKDIDEIADAFRRDPTTGSKILKSIVSQDGNWRDYSSDFRDAGGKRKTIKRKTKRFIYK